MVNSEKREPVNDREVDDMDCADRFNDCALDDASSVETTAVGTCSISGGSRNQIGIVERLTDVFVDEGDGDLLLQQNDREDRVLRWLQALDMQVMGACRADERLKPLLKLNVSSGTAEDSLLVHLSQHFEPSEVGKLARFLCVPLVSVRVGKIIKQGTLLCPTVTRGNLNLTLLPTSDLRISFIGDNGHIERLATLSSDGQCSDVSIEEISEEKSGRSFRIRIQGGEIFYFWCSEKSKVHGEELIGEMMDLLRMKPSLTELTGISVSRLDCFAICLPAYLVGTSGSNTQASSFLSVVSSADTSLESPELCPSVQSSSSSLSLRTSCLRHCSSQGLQSSLLYYGSQSPGSSSFEEGLPNSLSFKSVSMERFWQRGDAPVTGANNPSVSPHGTPEQSSSDGIDDEKFSQGTETCLFPPFSFLESLVKSAEPPFISPISEVPTISSTLLSPYYCWCPPIASTLQYKIVPPELPISSESLPPFSSFMSSTPPINLAEISSVDFPAFLPEPLVRLPLSMPTSQPIPTFTPLICDPIVHIPVIDVCSSGERYFGSAVPTISTVIPPLHPKFVNPLIMETKSVEEGARETLRLLVSRSSSNTGPSLMDVLPPLLTNSDETQNILAAGSRGLYCGYRDVGAISDTTASSGLVSSSKRLRTGMVAQRSAKQGDLIGDSGGSSKEKLCDSGGSSANDGGSSLSCLMEDGTD